MVLWRRRLAEVYVPLAVTEPFILQNVTEGTGLVKLNSVALVRERTIPTERPPPIGEVSANFCG